MQPWKPNHLAVNVEGEALARPVFIGVVLTNFLLTTVIAMSDQMIMDMLRGRHAPKN